MPQWRKLHTKTIDSYDMNAMPGDFARLLWVLLPLKLDSRGRGLDNAAWVRSNIFPLREDVTVEMVAGVMDWLAERGMIERYEVAGRRYFHVPTWEKYQGNTAREAESELPPPPALRPTQELVVSNSGVSQELVTSNSRLDVDADVDGEVDAEVDANADADAARAAATTTTTDVRLNAYQLYEQATGVIPPLAANQIKATIAACDTHRLNLPQGSPGADVDGDGWVVAAIQEAVVSGAQRINLKYLEAILDRWRQEGFQSVREGNGDGRRTSQANDRAKTSGEAAAAIQGRAVDAALRRRGSAGSA